MHSSSVDALVLHGTAAELTRIVGECGQLEEALGQLSRTGGLNEATIIALQATDHVRQLSAALQDFLQCYLSEPSADRAMAAEVAIAAVTLGDMACRLRHTCLQDPRAASVGDVEVAIWR